ncbi:MULTISPECIES: diadenylate cyclase CdaA [Caldanaerobacter]|uniref:Diadenylate cyclase n=1 Tax=Caldanaerobacter subterraneus TaxID=911092 RepID=A0A357VJQ3_9THEO|nr:MULTISPECIES: diadenylate cyclase CdaA [Caldanaerobacter]MBE3578825.1 TIGR00159 family protein [Caldanaerobacter subterraneus]MCS3915033.1 diadenylate cyclase [Caldanaerobacter subterraneus subsp. tengcongensis MB4]TCO67553.1 diadenylate cyclase [Caldanaerobacter subterraneus]HBT48593.1 TIGR00159 family protein [Caldanaerobacter subterraneus]
MFTGLIDIIKTMRINDIVDILIIAYVLYRLILVIHKTRAEQLLKGLAVLIIITKLSEWLQLRTVNYILRNAMTVGVIALLIVFQPELRRGLESLGRSGFLGKNFFFFNEDEKDMSEVIGEICDAVQYLSRSKIGALIVIERETGLNEIIETGIAMDSKISSELLINTFIPNTPLHDGAVIIRGDRIMAAGCFLPLTDNQNLSSELGTRHRAGLGVTEISDAIAIIVSEETGIISLAQNGRLSRHLDPKTLKEVLSSILDVKENKKPVWRKWGNKHAD